MTEQEVRVVVEAVVRVLTEKGYLKGGDSPSSCGCDRGLSRGSAASEALGAAHSGNVRVTVGTAGKVFQSQEWQPYKGTIPKDDDGHTHGPECPHCRDMA
ncbi:MAG: hypothetical protein WCI75_20955, partial [candidate division NC10 bacterium]